MPVNTPIPEYSKYLPQWTIVRDCVEGEINIKKGGELYLPKPSGQSEADYKVYKDRAKFFDGTSRTAEGYHGHIFSKPPVQSESTEAIENLLKDVDGAGTNINQFASDVVWDTMMTGWGGILVDHISVPAGATENAVPIKSFLKFYAAESIINWRYQVINGIKKLTLVVLREDEEEPKPDDEFVNVAKERYRVLSFEDGKYIQRLFERTKEGKFEEAYRIYPMMNNRLFDTIPFFTCPSESPDKSMLLGLAFENIGHYQKTADYENGLHFTGVPTPVVENMPQPMREENGRQVPATVLLGGSRMQFFYGGEGQNVNVKYLEFSGAGLTQLKNSLDDCLNRMAKLGLQAIGAEKRDAESAETVSMKRSAENGVLGAFARNMSDKITQAVRLMMKWSGIQEAGNWTFELNNTFNSSELSAQILQIMYSARRDGEIPRVVWYNQLVQSGKTTLSFEEFVEEIERDRTGGHGVYGDE